MDKVVESVGGDSLDCVQVVCSSKKKFWENKTMTLFSGGDTELLGVGKDPLLRDRFMRCAMRSLVRLRLRDSKFPAIAPNFFLSAARLLPRGSLHISAACLGRQISASVPVPLLYSCRFPDGVCPLPSPGPSHHTL